MSETLLHTEHFTATAHGGGGAAAGAPRAPPAVSPRLSLSLVNPAIWGAGSLTTRVHKGTSVKPSASLPSAVLDLRHHPDRGLGCSESPAEG